MTKTPGRFIWYELLTTDPKAAATSSLGCKSCHDAGRLAPTLAQLAAKPG